MLDWTVLVLSQFQIFNNNYDFSLLLKEKKISKLSWINYVKLVFSQKKNKKKQTIMVQQQFHISILEPGNITQFYITFNKLFAIILFGQGSFSPFLRLHVYPGNTLLLTILSKHHSISNPSRKITPGYQSYICKRQDILLFYSVNASFQGKT